MISTRCKFFYGHTVTDENNYIDFKEGVGSPLVARIDVGEYSLTDYCSAVASALNAAGALDYAVTVNRYTRKITITASNLFTLLGSSGSNIGFGNFQMLGFNAADTTSSTAHVADFETGSEWSPQFFIQDHIDFENNQIALDGSVKQATNGSVEAVKFGIKKIMECSFKYITNKVLPPGQVIENSQTGLDDARNFMIYATTKSDLEFMPDKNSPNDFSKCLLESTPEDQFGLSFKLKEMYQSGFVGFYETGILKFRKIE